MGDSSPSIRVLLGGFAHCGGSTCLLCFHYRYLPFIYLGQLHGLSLSKLVHQETQRNPGTATVPEYLSSVFAIVLQRCGARVFPSMFGVLLRTESSSDSRELV